MKTNRVKAFDLREELENNHGVTPESLLNYLMDCWMSGDDSLQAVEDFKNDVINNQNNQNSFYILTYQIIKTKDMKFIRLTNLKDSKPVFINPDFIGHMFRVPEKMSYGSIDEVEHTSVGVTTHNNGGFRVKETIEQIIKLIESSKS